MMLNTESFRPTPYLRNGHLQTILASSSFRAWGKNPMCDAAREMIITTSGDVKRPPSNHFSQQLLSCLG